MQHASFGRAVNPTQSVGRLPRSEFSGPVDLLLKFQLPAMPVLSNSSTAADSAETGFVYSSDSKEQAKPRTSRTVWDEAPMALAHPPKWRSLVVRAITNGLALATGSIDVDDVDSPRRRTR